MAGPTPGERERRPKPRPQRDYLRDIAVNAGLPENTFLRSTQGQRRVKRADVLEKVRLTVETITSHTKQGDDRIALAREFVPNYTDSQEDLQKLSPAERRLRDERTQAFIQLAEGALGITTPIAMSNGLFALSIVPELREYQSFLRENNLTGQTHHVMIGALTGQTASETATMARSIDPNAKVTVIDMMPSTQLRNPPEGRGNFQFLEGNALSLPLEDRSVDIVYTNLLMRSLVENSDERPDKPYFLQDMKESPSEVILIEAAKIEVKRQRLLSEIYRVLKPGGRAILVEPYWCVEDEGFPTIVQNAGFPAGALSIVRAKSMNRREADRVIQELPALTPGVKFELSRDDDLVVIKKPL